MADQDAQLFPDSKTPEKHTEVLFDITTEAYKRENIEQMQLEISSKKLLPFSPVSNRGLLNVFTGAKALPTCHTGSVCFPLLVVDL